jgi:nucleotide-binding universal stress UspA family protein
MTPASFRAILVPLDGSEIGQQAIEVAARLARHAGAALHLAMAHQPPPAGLLASELPRVAEEVEAESRAREAAYLEAVAEGVRCAHGLCVTTALLEGPPARALADEVRARHIDLVVMTTHGRGGLNRWWLGSVTDRLLRLTRAPVLLLHPRTGVQPTEFRRVLAALDGESDDAVLECALAGGSRAASAAYVLTRVGPTTTPLMSPLPAYPIHGHPDWARRQDLEARNYLARLSSRLASLGFHTATQVVAAEGIAESVLEIAASTSADLIAVGTHGAAGVERLLLGSVADKVIRGAAQPVLVVPQPRK